MDIRISYEESVNAALRRIASHVPEDLVQQFAEKSGIRQDDIHPIAPGPAGTVSAVDGSNAMVLDGGTFALAVIRAARTTFSKNVRDGRAVTPLTLVTIDRSVPASAVFRGGSTEAHRRFGQFLTTRLNRFSEDCNDPGGRGGSGMSPYLHFGQVSPVTLALQAQEQGGDGVPEFLEELIVRRELSVNFVRYNDA